MARGTFWTIIVDDQPTAFRAPVREDLLPTLKQLQRQHPTATIKWFQRGRLWETPGDAMDAQKPPRRGASWRPGGEHKDPREVYKVPRDVKRARWASQAAEGRGPWMKGKDRAPFDSAQGKPSAERGDRPAWKPKGDRAPGAGFRAPGDRGERTGWKPKSDRPSGDRPFTPRGDRPAWSPKGERADGPPKPRGEGGWKPKGDGRETGSGSRGAGSGERPAWKPKSDRPVGDRPAWKPKGDRPTGDRPAWKPKGDRPAGDRPAWKPKGDRAPGTGYRAPEGKPERRAPFDSAQGKPNAERGDRPAWKPKGDRAGRPAGDRPFTPRGDRPAWSPKGERPDGPPKPRGEGGWKPKADRPGGDRPFTPRGDKAGGDRPAWKPSGPGIRRGTGTGAPRADWRERSTRSDATPRSGGAAPAAKRGKTWRVGELPPADRKKKKDE